jgi:hypothetical protein
MPNGLSRNDATLAAVQRRSLLKLGVAGTVTLALLGGGAAMFYEPAWRDGRLTDAGRRVLRAIARAVLDGSLPADSGPQAAALASHMDRMGTTLRAMPNATQREVGDLLAILASPPGRLALAGLATDWLRADVAHIQAALQAMRTSRLNFRRQAYHALRDLTHAAYFASGDTWIQLGYPGPTNIE